LEWEKAMGPSTDASFPLLGVAGFPPGEKRLLGPKASGLHPEVLRRLALLEAKLPKPVNAKPSMRVNSGRHQGPPSESMHNQALAVDLVIDGLNSIEVAKLLKAVGFSCVIEYYEKNGKPCRMAHGDLRGTPWAKASYAPGGRKERSCPQRAYSKTGGCANQRKAQWVYYFGP
jgi:hypothetical protein